MATAKYEILLSRGIDSAHKRYVEDVAEVKDLDGMLYFQDTEGFVAFAAPKANVLFFRRED